MSSTYKHIPLDELKLRLSSRNKWLVVAMGKLRWVFTVFGEIKGVVLPIDDIERLEIEATAQPPMAISQFRKNIVGNLPESGYLPLTYHTRSVLVVLHPDYMTSLDLPVFGDQDKLFEMVQDQ